MHIVSVTREVAAPREEVWSVLDDFGRVAEYNPGVDASQIIDGPDTGTGAVRECHLSGGSRIEEEIVEYEAGQRYVVEFVDMGNLPMKANRVEIRVDAVDDHRSRVTVRSTFTPKYGPIGWLMAKVMMRSRLQSAFEDMLDGLDSHLNAGQVSENGQVPDGSAVVAAGPP